MADILSIGVSGLNVAQRALSTTGHNISNVNTAGYSRQTVEQASRQPQLFGSNYLGTGVDISSIKRVYDQFLVTQVRTNTSSFSSIDTFQQYASTLDNLLGDASTGLNTGIDNFFAAVQQVSSDPSSLAARQTLLSQAASLVNGFKTIDDALDQQYGQVNAGLKDAVASVNTLASSIAALNAKIVSSPGAADGSMSDLLDQRDQALAQLSSLVSVTGVAQSDGSINVFIGNGQSLVVGTKSQSLSIVPNKYDSSRSEVGFVTSGASVEVSSQLSGGTIGGLLSYRAQMLDPTQNSLGRLAIGMADALNSQHRLGMDLNGDLGGDLFSTSAPTVTGSSANAGTGTVGAAILNVNELTASDYQLTFNGGNGYTLTRLSDGKNFAIDTGGSSPYATDDIDGLSLTIGAGAVAGDSFLIQPTKLGADKLGVLISDPAKVAAAVPVAASASLSNIGSGVAGQLSVNKPGDRVVIQFTGPATFDVLDQTTGATLAQGLSYTSGADISFNGWTTQISDGGTGPAAGDVFYVDQGVAGADAANAGGAGIAQAVMNPPDPHLTDPVTITFTSASTFTVSGATTGSPVTGVNYTDGGVISYNGWSFTLSGTPAAGDSFTIRANTQGVGDNGNMQQLAALQNGLTLAGGTASFQDAYGAIVADVGSKTQAAGTSRDAANSLLQQSISARDAVSGVNLDEEAANMLKYQQAYQAAAKVIAMSDTLFQTILSAIDQ
jgi:flagellar hook-associated protein 1 FlgK